ncbi:MAG TPA: hypothetical protein VEP68_06665 [Anaeromyxobacteraceae bacterium]|nr:hypothetical protein [Anaeromyxobacteraceae bacterium]
MISIKRQASGGETAPGEVGVKRCDEPGDLRCGCGSLLARVVGRAVELKCRRCKRTWRVPLSG